MTALTQHLIRWPIFQNTVGPEYWTPKILIHLRTMFWSFEYLSYLGIFGPIFRSWLKHRGKNVQNRPIFGRVFNPWSEYQTFVNQMVDHLDARLVRYSDLHCRYKRERIAGNTFLINHFIYEDVLIFNLKLLEILSRCKTVNRWFRGRVSKHLVQKTFFFLLSALLRELGSLCWDHSIQVRCLQINTWLGPAR